MYLGRKYEFYLMYGTTILTLSFDSADGSLENDIEQSFDKLRRIEGGNVYSLFQMTEGADAVMASLENKYAGNVELRRLTRTVSTSKIPVGSYFIKHLTSSPLPDHLRSLNTLHALDNGLDRHAEDDRFCRTWLWLYCMFETYSYGWSDRKVFIGTYKKGHRRCRFCPNTDDAKFGKRENAHAISESLGNKKLFSTEECTECNSEFAGLEEHFNRLMDVRRTMYGVSGKHSASHCVQGQNFVIRPDGPGSAPMVYLKRSCVPAGFDESSSFVIKLEHGIPIVNEKIYQAVVKYVLNLLPEEHMQHFTQTIRWLKGSMCSDTLPPMLAGYHDRVFLQPVIDIFINSRKKLPDTPYCTAVLYTCDVAYMFVIPFCSIDAGRFKTQEAVMKHYRRMAARNPIVTAWEWQNTSDYWKGTAWCNWKMTPGMFRIREDDDAVFDLHESPYKDKDSEKAVFPALSELGQIDCYPDNIGFDSLATRPVADAELVDSSVNLLHNTITFVDAHTIRFEFAVLVQDIGNTEPFFGYSLSVRIKTEKANTAFYRIIADGRIAVSQDLIHYIYAFIFQNADRVLGPKRQTTLFRNCTLCRLLSPGTVRLLERHTIVVENEGKSIITAYE